MKRDADVVRNILLATEAMPAGEYLAELPGVDAENFAFHVSILIEAGFVDGRVQTFLGGGSHAVVLRLTWAGCDFLDAARSDTLWAKAKTSVIKPSASWTFDLLKEWLKAEISSGLPTLRGLTS